MLSGTRLRDDARLTHLLGQQDLSDGVVDLVGTRVIQVLTLQVELAAVLLTHALGIVERRGPAHVVFQQRVVSLLELRGLDDRQVGVLQVVYALVEYLRHVGTAELSVKSSFIYKIAFFHFLSCFCVIKHQKKRLAAVATSLWYILMITDTAISLATFHISSTTTTKC